MITKRTTKYTGLALAESARSTYDRVRIGSVIVRGKTILGKGANLCTSHPLQFFWNTKTKRIAPQHNLHSEMHAIVRALRKWENLQGAEIFVARLDRIGRLADCRPCAACRAALESVGISKVTYTTPKGIKHE